MIAFLTTVNRPDGPLNATPDDEVPRYLHPSAIHPVSCTTPITATVMCTATDNCDGNNPEDDETEGISTG